MMTEYYRVRSQEQWEWLANKLNIYCVKSMGCPVIIEHEQGRKYYNAFQYYGGFEPVIEVSQLMEDEKMKNEDYVTIKGEDLEKVHWETNYGHTSFINHDENSEKYAHEQYLPANLSIPKSLLYPKVCMSVAEKKEFDELKSDWQVLICAFDAINEIDYPRWFSRLNDYPDDNNEHQLEFARAWADPSLIEVIPEKKWNVKIPPFSRTNSYYFKVGKNLASAESEYNGDEDQQFTESELKKYELDDDMYEKVEVKE